MSAADPSLAAFAPEDAPSPPLAHETPEPPAAAGGRARGRAPAAWVGISLLGLLLAGAAARVAVRASAARALARVTARDARRTVLVAPPGRADAARTLLLPGTLRGRQEAAVYARASGYLRSWRKDLGDPVKKGEVLAQIDAPEADLELRQARAARDQVAARSALAQSSIERWEALRGRDAVSQQEVDERRGAQRQAAADLAAAEANVRRLEALEAYRTVVAPFDGVVVRRNVEVGALVGGGSAARELFYVAQVDALRVDVFVPQAYAAEVHVGQEVTVRQVEKPGAGVKGVVARTGAALDPATRTLQIAIELPNPARAFLPGSYVEVVLDLAGGEPPLTVPPGAVQFRQGGARVAVVEGGRVSLRPVTLGRDHGRALEVQSGIGPHDQIVQSPHDSIEDGERVETGTVPRP